MSDNVEDYFEVWKSCREDVIKLLRDLGDEIQKHENNSRIAILTGSSASGMFAVIFKKQIEEMVWNFIVRKLSVITQAFV